MTDDQSKAARYRKRAQAAEAERDQLREQLDAATAAHDGLTCAQTEALLNLRTRQWKHRERQATHRLTPEEWRATVLDMFSAVEALNEGRVDDLPDLAPTTIAQYRAQLAAAVEGLASLSADDPAALSMARNRVVASSYTREAIR